MVSLTTFSRADSILRTRPSLLAILCSVLLTSQACSHRNVTWDQEVLASRHTADWLDQKYGTIVDPDIDLFLQRIAQRLANSAQGRTLDHFHSSAMTLKPAPVLWHVAVLNTNDVNAFSTGGGVVYVTRGLIDGVESEAQLAAIIAHEMSHQLLGHTREALAESFADKPNTDSSEEPQYAYSLEQEIEADTLSLGLIIAARYDPQSTLQALSIGYRLGLKDVHPILDPTFKQRAASLEQKMQEEGSVYPGTSTTREFTRVQRRVNSSEGFRSTN